MLVAKLGELEATTDSLSFPVLCIGVDGSVTTAASAERLSRCNARALFKTHYFRDLLIIDADQRAFRVVKAEPHPPLTQVQAILRRIINGNIPVRLRLTAEDQAPLEQVPLEEVKRRVIACIERDPDLWEGSRHMDEWRQLVKEVATIRQLIERLR